MEEIENVELEYLALEDYEDLRDAMKKSYHRMADDCWEREQIKTLLDRFPEGQVVVKVNDRLAGCALSIIVRHEQVERPHTHRQITGDETFRTHNKDGDILYGIDVFVKPEYRGLRLGRRMYDYRKELCERLNLRGIFFGGRIPNYYKYSDEMRPKEYIDKVRSKEINDPVLNFQLSNDFSPVRVMKGYLDGDAASEEYAVLLKWDNIYFEPPQSRPRSVKTDVRLGLVQWQMRPYRIVDELMDQVEFFIESLSRYRSDFAVLPEFFDAPLMAGYNHLSESEAIRKLASYTPQVVDRLSSLAISFNINIVSGSFPEVVDERLYNAGYLCKRDGSVDRYEKLHVTPDEAQVWGLQGGNSLKTFDTDCGKVGVLICYDVEFPELPRLLADEGMDILFVPFLTDTQNGYSRVRHCAQARAIENECYVAIVGSVGNLPKVHNMDIQYAESMVCSPCDFAFPVDGVKAQATPNSEMILVADVDMALLRELHSLGSVRNLLDRRKDLFELKRVTPKELR